MKDNRIGHRWTKTLFYVLFLAICTGVAVELGARVLLTPVADAQTIRHEALARLLNSAIVGGVDTPLGLRLSPNTEQTVRTGELNFTVTTNTLGYRGPEPAPRAQGEYRVLYLGDSMVFGHGLNEHETLPQTTASLLHASGRAARAYNGAISGMNTVQELVAARQLLPLVAPDHVVLGYFVGNDPLANMLSHMDEAGKVMFDADRVELLRARLDAHLRPLAPSVAFRAVALRYYVPRLRYWWSDNDAVMARSVELVQQIQRLSTQAGARFGVLLIYPRDGVAGGLTSLMSGSRGIGRGLAARLRSAGIPVLDSAEYLDGPEPDRAYYFHTDGHLNAAGARQLAEIVVSEMLLAGDDP